MPEAIRILEIRVNDCEVFRIDLRGDESTVEDSYKRLLNPAYGVSVLDLIKAELAEQCKQAINRANLQAIPMNPPITKKSEVHMPASVIVQDKPGFSGKTSVVVKKAKKPLEVRLGSDFVKQNNPTGST